MLFNIGLGVLLVVWCSYVYLNNGGGGGVKIGVKEISLVWLK